MENPRTHYVARRLAAVTTHASRSRKLRTDAHHASLPGSGRVTREYQFDAPSRKRLSSGLGCPRASPKPEAKPTPLPRALTGSFISVGQFTAPGQALSPSDMKGGHSIALNLEDGSTGLTTLSLSKGLAGPPLFYRRSLREPGLEPKLRHDPMTATGSIWI